MSSLIPSDSIDRKQIYFLTNMKHTSFKLDRKETKLIETILLVFELKTATSKQLTNSAPSTHETKVRQTREWEKTSVICPGLEVKGPFSTLPFVFPVHFHFDLCCKTGMSEHYLQLQPCRGMCVCWLPVGRCHLQPSFFLFLILSFAVTAQT